jgi:structure-specific endonuclease subunit SLX1
MHMNVHGFPSKLAALQFEWAWQHPQLSRHLRGDDGRALIVGGKRATFRSNVLYVLLSVSMMYACVLTMDYDRAARIMVATMPYSNWPLHLKLYSEEAVKAWEYYEKLQASRYPLPHGFTISIELEGVDGKSGKPGTGRTGPVDFMDGGWL